MNTRIKEVRKALGLSGAKFGEKIGISNAGISKIEKCVNNPSEQTIKLICKEFNVNEKWLRTGTGDMFVEKTQNDAVAEFVGKMIATDNKAMLAVLEEASKLSDEDLKKACRFIENVAKNIK